MIALHILTPSRPIGGNRRGGRRWVSSPQRRRREPTTLRPDRGSATMMLVDRGRLDLGSAKTHSPISHQRRNLRIWRMSPRLDRGIDVKLSEVRSQYNIMCYHPEIKLCYYCYKTYQIFHTTRDLRCQ